MRLSVSVLRTGLLAAWIAVVAIVCAPVASQARMWADMAGGSVPICLSDASGHPAGVPGSDDHRGMIDCTTCLCCAPLLAVMPALPAAALSGRVVVATIETLPPARAPPQAARTIAFARGPPASV